MKLSDVLTSLESIVTAALLVGGVVMLLVSLYQYRNPPVGIARIVSPMAKQLIGMLCILFAVLVFLSQFIPERGP